MSEDEPEDRVDDSSRHAVVWTPEDAAHFLTSAIKESQRPLAEALARPGVPVRVVYLGCLVGVIFMCGMFFQLYQAQHHIRSVEEERQALSGKIEHAQGELRALSENRSAQAISLVTLRQERVDAQSRLDAAQMKLDEAQAELARKNHALGQARQQGAELESAVMTALRKRFDEAARERDAAQAQLQQLKDAQARQGDVQREKKTLHMLLSQSQDALRTAREENLLLATQIENQKTRIQALQAELETAHKIAELRARLGGAGEQAAPEREGADASTSHPDATIPDAAPAPNVQPDGSAAPDDIDDSFDSATPGGYL